MEKNRVVLQYAKNSETVGWGLGNILGRGHLLGGAALFEKGAANSLF